MGRRALRKPDPSLDLSWHLRVPDDLPRPCTSQTLFENDAPLEVEVGSGKGLFMATASGEHPQRNFLGIEVAGKYARFAGAKLAREKRLNAIMVHGDGLAVFRDSIPDHSLAAIHVYFPDPWWKARHRKRRVMNEAFLLDIERTLIQGGKLHFWTDVEEYFLTTLEMIAEKSQKLEGPIPVSEKPAEHDLDYRTHFERRMRKHGESVFRSEFRLK